MSTTTSKPTLVDAIRAAQTTLGPERERVMHAMADAVYDILDTALPQAEAAEELAEAATNVLRAALYSHDPAAQRTLQALDVALRRYRGQP